MLTIALEEVWDRQTQSMKDSATVKAQEILANLVHYQSGKSYYTDDVERLAAEPRHVFGNRWRLGHPTYATVGGKQAKHGRLRSRE